MQDVKKRPTVGLVLADTESYVLANNAIQQCVGAFAFDQVTVFTDQPSFWPQYRTVTIPRMTGVADYNAVILRELPHHMDTDFVIIAQFDGFILNGAAFSQDYFRYDYIGAVWPNYAEHRVGNGGFSWRSRRLVEAVAQHIQQHDGQEAEDLFICRRLRPTLEQQHHCVFADEATANAFSHEIVPTGTATFGFHGVFHLPEVYRNSPHYLIENLPQRSLTQQLGFILHGVNKLDAPLAAQFRQLIAERLATINATAAPAAQPVPAPPEPAQPEPAPSVPSDADVLYQHLQNMGQGRSSEWMPFAEKAPVLTDKRLVAYYLPQFHAIAENDAYWGKGFTEWRNVARALPLFEGHYQPRHPADLGFYDLHNDKVLEQQAALARNYGISGWAFYYYWFDSHKLLEMPIERLYRRRDIDIEYCVFWANENWTRSWDGMQGNVLLQQNHTPQDDLAFIQAVSRYFEDGRYIRRDGRPVLMMYRPQLLPDARATTDRWRNWCVQHGFGDPYLIATQAYGLTQPSHYGFDAAAEFPPHRGTACKPELLRAPALGRRFGPQRQIQGIDYASAVNAWSNSAAQHDEKLFKCVFPMWDNSSRRVSSIPTIFHGATPQLYETWLRYCLQQAQAGDFVFVNAWNEWAEGAYLEPDLHMGHAYLEATWRALQASAR